jgi:hypothetical protein
MTLKALILEFILATLLAVAYDRCNAVDCNPEYGDRVKNAYWAVKRRLRDPAHPILTVQQAQAYNAIQRVGKGPATLTRSPEFIQPLVWSITFVYVKKSTEAV